ncbi:M23 family metallopeptidase [Clostridiaceae bacterium OttesenSCG-928-D20]|nr:M23 family metallopeptidase [Clostridiaceae bacterium OttesenSCG-928-D20]
MIKLKSAFAVFLILFTIFLKFISPDMADGIKSSMKIDTDFKETFVSLGAKIANENENIIKALGLKPKDKLSSGTDSKDANFRLTSLLEVHERAVSSSKAQRGFMPENSRFLGGSTDANPDADSNDSEEPNNLPTDIQPEPEPDPLELAVSAFLETQSEYEGHDIPDNVIVECIHLPFECTSPVIGETSSGFGFRNHPLENILKFHFGTDFAVWSGTDILAFADGVVEKSVMATQAGVGNGNYIVIDHGDGYKTLYAHCSKLLAEEGATVKKGDLIALVGDTGYSTGPHLHLELTKDGSYLNPEFYV